MGFDVHRSTGAARVILGAVGGNERAEPALIEMLDGVREVVRITEPYKLASRSFRPEGTVVDRRGRADRRRRGGRDGRSLLGRVRGAGARRRGRRQARRRQDPARRRLQAAQFAVQLPGARRGRAPAAALGGRRAEPQGRLRGDGRRAGRAGGALRRHPAGRRAQHAELHAAARARARAQAGAAQARHRGDDRGVAAVGRVRAGRRQHRRHPLRARHPHLRELHAEHARHLGDPGREEAEPPADHRRPEPRHRAAATRWRRWRGPRSPPAPTA